MIPISHPDEIENKSTQRARRNLVSPSLVLVQMSLSASDSWDDEGASSTRRYGNLLLNPKDLIDGIALGLVLGAVKDLLGSLGKLWRCGSLRRRNWDDDSRRYG